MFQAPDGKTWEPYKIRQVKKPVVNGADVEMGGTEGENKKVDDEEPEFEEDIESDEDAVYPLTEGRITNMPAFLALLNHVHNTLSPTLHTPILLIAQAAWTAQDHEALTQFFFEKFKTPAFCIMDSALAIAYGYGVQNATVVDVGYKKVDITAITDFSVHHVGRTIALPGGGDAMTERLLELLGPKGWTKDMCEQLKKSQICEILPASVPLPGEGEGAAPSNPAAAASTGATSSGASAKVSDIPRGPGPDTEVGEENLDIDGKVIDDEGVLDVASIVASGKTQEFLAAQEKKKAAAAARKATKDAKDLADSTAKQIRLPNSKRERVIFHYQERKNPDEAEASEQKRQKTPEAGLADVPTEEGQAPAVVDAPDTVVAVDDQSAKKEQARAAKREEKRKAREGQGDPTLFRREIEVGTERFLATTGGNLDNIADAMHRTVSSVVDLGKRAELWESVVIVGNGCRVRGEPV
jgi:actin-related protein 9